jgi:hypothetical protein
MTVRTVLLTLIVGCTSRRRIRGFGSEHSGRRRRFHEATSLVNPSGLHSSLPTP